MNKVIILIAGLFFLFIFILFLVFLNKQKTESIPSPTPSSNIDIKQTPKPEGQQDFDYSPQYKEQVKEIIDKEGPLRARDSLVSALINKLPYAGNNFSMRFDFDNAQFIVEIDKANPQEGNIQFDEFLKVNNIESRSWFRNLKIQ